ncbi:MAG: hypothetical protein ACF8R7_15675 [Phycisphaerales bacterium JB039]
MRALVCGVIVGSVAGAATADTVDIGFEGLSHGALVTTQYSSQGATFSGVTFGSPSVVTPTGTSYPDAPLAGQSGANYLGPAFGNDYVEITFDSSIFVTEFSAVGLDIGENGFRIEAYDGATLVDSTQVFGSGFGLDEYYELSLSVASGFDRIRIGQAIPFFLFGSPSGSTGPFDSAYAIDDASYTFVPIPLPPAAWAGLLGLGLVGGIHGMKRRRA